MDSPERWEKAVQDLVKYSPTLDIRKARSKAPYDYIGNQTLPLKVILKGHGRGKKVMPGFGFRIEHSHLPTFEEWADFWSIWDQIFLQWIREIYTIKFRKIYTI